MLSGLGVPVKIVGMGGLIFFVGFTTLIVYRIVT
jgi:hypothetical protein